MKKVGKGLREVLKNHPDWTPEMTKGTHVRLVHVSGAVVFTALTPSDCRARKNLEAHLRRVEREYQDGDL